MTTRRRALSKEENLRRQRLADHYRYLRGRYGTQLPPDDGGREDLYELLLVISSATCSYRKMKMATQIWAGWMADDEAEQLIDRVNQTPDYLRKRTKQKLGEIWGLTYDERQAWKIRTVRPCDITEEEFLRRQKDRKYFLELKRRLAAGRMTRAQYRDSLANSLSRTKPWVAEGVGRSTYYRRLKQARETTPLSGTGSSANEACLLPESTLSHLSKVRGESGTSAVAVGEKQGSKRSNGRKIA
jgi:hypothetical protein